MQFCFQPITPMDAEAILLWRYPRPFDLYNMKAPVSQLLEPAYHYHVSREGEQVAAFLCWGQDARVAGFDYDDAWTDVGWGLRPDLTGRGLGKRFICDVASFVGTQRAGGRLRATVAAFNVRCRKACNAAGFVETAHFARPSDEMPFVVMTGGFPAA